MEQKQPNLIIENEILKVQLFLKEKNLSDMEKMLAGLFQVKMELEETIISLKSKLDEYESNKNE